MGSTDTLPPLSVADPATDALALLGWSASTTVRMAQRYGHIGPAAQRDAMNLLESRACVTLAAFGAR
jgi:hypothetical protein